VSGGRDEDPAIAAAVLAGLAMAADLSAKAPVYTKAPSVGCPKLDRLLMSGGSAGYGWGTGSIDLHQRIDCQ